MNLRHLLASCLIAALPFAASAQQGFGQTNQAYPPTQGVTDTAQYPAQQGGWGNAPMPQQDPYAAQPAPNAGAMAMPQPGGMTGGQPQPTMQPAMAARLQGMLQAELQDFGVPPSNQLHEVMHGPTPTSIPGGQVITSDRLMMLYQQGQQSGLLVFDVLNGGTQLPMAQNAIGAAQPGSFNDQTQQQFGQYLAQVTQGNKARPMVFYCQGPQCWMSYNAALRAIHMGYSQVYWYRGGIEAWGQMQQMAMGMAQPSAQAPGAFGAMPQGNWPGNP